MPSLLFKRTSSSTDMHAFKTTSTLPRVASIVDPIIIRYVLTVSATDELF